MTSKSANRGSNDFPLPAVQHLRKSPTERDSAGAAHFLQSYWVTFDPPVSASCVVLESNLPLEAVGRETLGGRTPSEVVPHQRAPFTDGLYLMRL